jgi:hypothetical protein
MLIAIQPRDAGYFRGLGFLGAAGRRHAKRRGSPVIAGLRAYGLGQDEGTGDDSYIYNAEDTASALGPGVTDEGYSDPDYSIIAAESEGGTIPITTAALPSTLTAPSTSPYAGLTSAAPGTVTGTVNGQPAVVNSAGVVVPGVMNSAGVVVPQSSLATALQSIPASYWLIGIVGIVVLSMGRKKR